MAWLILIPSTGIAWDFPLDLSPVAIKFNHGSSGSAFAIKKGGNVITAPEYDRRYSKNEKFAYKKNTSPIVKIWLEADPFDSPPVTIDAINTVGLASWNLDDTVIYFNGSGFSIGEGDNYVSMATESGYSIPNCVDSTNVYWAWRVVAVDGVPRQYPYVGGSSNHSFYVVLDTPQDPLSVPWTEVLDKACYWADGETNASLSSTDIRNSLFSSGFTYETSSGTQMYGTISAFNLTGYLNDFGSNYEVNCSDMAKALVSFGNAIGCNLRLTTYGYTTSGETAITGPVNCIDPIGSASPTNNVFSTPLINDDCRTGKFVFHSFVELYSTQYYWDATLNYDTDADSDNVTGSNPGCGNTTYGHNWSVPANESGATYLSRLFDSWPVQAGTPSLARNRSFNVQ
jgi:hypothetical protein